MPALVETQNESEVLSCIGSSHVTVVVPVFNAYEDFVLCIEGIERNTDVLVPVLVVDDCGPDRRLVEFIRRVSVLSKRQFVLLENGENLGFVGSCNRAFNSTGNADVVIVNSDVVVGPKWLDGMLEAAGSSNLIATVSTLTNCGTVLSTPVRNAPSPELDGSLTPESAARIVYQAGLGMNPTIPTAVGHCVLIRRFALQLLGGFDEKFGKGYGEEVDFSLRAVRYGLRNVVADKVFVYHKGNGSFGVGNPLYAKNDQINRWEFPWYGPWVEAEIADMHSPLADAIVVSAVALRGLHLGVDARCLGSHLSGTQRVVLETIRALSKVNDVSKLLVYLSGELPSYAIDYIGECHGVQLVLPDESGKSDDCCDVIYRPYQLQHPSDIEWLRRHGNRVIINQLDVIAYNNPSYFENFASWSGYRELTKFALSVVDGVGFISEHARKEAVIAGLVGDATPMSVVGCGTDSEFELPTPEAPRAFPSDQLPIILCLGTSYHHKNRVWAIKLFRELSARGWDGRLVLAGLNPPAGSSRPSESELVLSMGDLADRVSYLGGISEAEKHWLMGRSTLVLYPTVVEGFGLIPFEAAAQGLPVLSTRQGSLDEVLPAGVPTVNDLDLGAATDLAFLLLTDDDFAKSSVAAIQLHSLSYAWSGVAERVVQLARLTISRPGRSVLTLDAGKLIEWYDSVSTDQAPKEIKPLQYWLEEFARVKPQHIKALRYIVPENSKRQTAFRQFINYLRSRVT